MIDLDPFDVVRRVAINHIDPCLIDQFVGEVDFLPRNIIPPISSPMKGSNDGIALLLHLVHSFSDALDGVIREIP